MEVARTSETSVRLYDATWSVVPEGCRLCLLINDHRQRTKSTTQVAAAMSTKDGDMRDTLNALQPVHCLITDSHLASGGYNLTPETKTSVVSDM
jgi:hypothetical protein